MTKRDKIYSDFYDSLWAKCKEETFKTQFVAHNLILDLTGYAIIKFDKKWFDERINEFNQKYLIESWIEAKIEAFENEETIINELVEYYYFALLEHLSDISLTLLSNKL